MNDKSLPVENNNKKPVISRLRKKKAPQVNNVKDITREDILKHLHGRTLMIYFVVLNKKSIGVRDLQRRLDLSSPSVAKYHLEKLVNLNLVENRNGIYHLNKKADLPVLTSWILIGKILIPRVIFAAIFFTILFVGYLVFIFSFWNKNSNFGNILGIFL